MSFAMNLIYQSQMDQIIESRIYSAGAKPVGDRKEKKQDYTPKSLARFMGMLAGDGETITDMCAGSGALIIQKWNQDHDIEFRAIEIDGNVIPFLLFNMVLRNIRCDIYQMDALTDEEPTKTWTVEKREVFGCIT